jgi:hypothetical protein
LTTLDDDHKDDGNQMLHPRVHIEDILCLRTTNFKIIHVSELNASSPSEKYINEALNLTNNNYSLVTVKDRRQLPNTLFDDCDVILTSFRNRIDEAKFGDLLANAIDAGKNVVCILLSNTTSYQHAKGRFLAEKYNATTRVERKSLDAQLGQVHQTYHPLMTNISQITLGTYKYRSMGEIAAEDTSSQNVQRIADWSDGKVLIATRVNKPGLVTDISCSFGETYGAMSDAPQLLNNALRYMLVFV